MSVSDGTTVAIILARGGSKGVPRKNTRAIAGKPCVAWTIEHAASAESVSAILVSSDDRDVLDIGGAREAWTDERPAEEATDTATIDVAARGALRRWEDATQLRGERIVVLYGNVPVRPPGLIDRAVSLMLDTNCDSVQSYARVGKHHPWWTARIEPESDVVSPWEGELLNHGVYRRQDLPPAHIPDGGVLVVSRASLLLELPGVAQGPHAFLGRDHRGVETREGEVVDIDSEVDLLVADAILRSERSERGERQHANR